MHDLAGIISLIIVSFLCIIIALRIPQISKIIIVGLILRVFLILYGHYISPLPDSTADMESFDSSGWHDYGKQGFIYTISNFPGPSSNFISWFLGIPYSFFGRSVLLAQSLSLFFGVLSIIMTWLIAKEIWDNHSASKAGWTMALFPSLLLYSVLILREVYIVFFLLIALYGIVLWFKNFNIKAIIISSIGFLGTIFFHGAMMPGALIFIIFVIFTSLKLFFKSLLKLNINYMSII